LTLSLRSSRHQKPIDILLLLYIHIVVCNQVLGRFKFIYFCQSNTTKLKICTCLSIQVLDASNDLKWHVMLHDQHFKFGLEEISQVRWLKPNIKAKQPENIQGVTHCHHLLASPRITAFDSPQTAFPSLSHCGSKHMLERAHWRASDSDGTRGW